jgi:putative aldouronate transport system substrate-binding protein
MKKILCMIMVCLFVISLAACGSSNNGATGSSTASTTATTVSATESTTAKTTVEDKSPITFTVFREDTLTNDDNFQGDVSKQILADTGVTIKYEFPVGDVEQKVSLMLASDEYPDMVAISHQNDMYIKQGAIIKLDDLIGQYGPNIKKMYGEDIKRLRYNLNDLSIYSLCSSGANEKQNVPGIGFGVQLAVLKEQGYPKIDTVQQFEDVIKKYIDAHPKIDGKPTIGLSLLADDWRMMISVRNPMFSANGMPDDGDWYVDQNTGAAQIAFRRPEVKEYCRWLNHMNDIGLLDKESFVQKYEQYTAKITAGRVLGVTDAAWEIMAAENALIAAGKPERTYMLFPTQLGTTTKSHIFRDNGLAAGWGIAITKNCKDPVRAMKFLDYMASEKSQIMINWGIEGTHYQVVDGKRQYLPKYADMRKNDNANFVKTTSLGLYTTTPWPHYGVGALDSNGDYYSPDSSVDQVIAGYTQPKIDALKSYGAKINADLYPQAPELPKSKYGIAWTLDFAADSEEKVIMQKYSDEWKKSISLAIMSKPSDFDRIWDEFQEKLINYGVEKIEASFTKLIQDRIKLYND